MNERQANKIWFVWSKLAETTPARFRRYGPLAREDAERLASEISEGGERVGVGDVALTALAKVAWNTALAESLTPVLQAVEIGLRNYVDRAVGRYRRERMGDPSYAGWLLTAGVWLHRNDAELLEKARQKLQRQVDEGNRRSFGHDDLLATASFALWSNMIRSNEVWSALSEYQGGKLTEGESRKSLHKTFDDVRKLRNRAYHLEPIFAQPDLWGVYEDAKRKLALLDPRVDRLMAALDRFPAVYDGGNGWIAYVALLHQHYGLQELEKTGVDQEVESIVATSFRENDESV